MEGSQPRRLLPQPLQPVALPLNISGERQARKPRYFITRDAHVEQHMVIHGPELFQVFAVAPVPENARDNRETAIGLT